jgi:GNAT superfamily N-acetyltransferase
MLSAPNNSSLVTIAPATSAEEIAIARALFQEYAVSISIDLCFQHFETELATLPGAYAPPTGCLLLARINQQTAGCIALRQMNSGVAELKRLYVRPRFRKRGCGKALVEAALSKARRIGYRTARLDTLREMHDAISLYRTFGFGEVPPYRAGEPEGICYFEMPLDPTSP